MKLAAKRFEEKTPKHRLLTVNWEAETFDVRQRQRYGYHLKSVLGFLSCVNDRCWNTPPEDVWGNAACMPHPYNCPTAFVGFENGKSAVFLMETELQ